MKSDEEKLRELFEGKEEPTFNKTVKKAKTVSVIRIIVISFMIFIIVSSAFLISNTFILNSVGNKKMDNLRTWYNVAMPNAYMGSEQIDDRIMIGEINYERYRFLGDKPITDGTYKETYTYMPLINGIYGNKQYYLYNKSGESYEELQKMITYNKVGKRVMKFYHPLIKYDNYINDLEILKDIDGNKLMELSLSFDKAYSIEEVKNMLPSNITLNWFWVDTFTKEEIKNINKDESSLEGIYEYHKIVFEEYDVYGIKALNQQGKPEKNPEEGFIISIMRGQQGSDYKHDYDKLFNTLSTGKGEITKEDLKIIGVVVSGDVETLKFLKDMKYIKAATIGAVADKY